MRLLAFNISGLGDTLQWLPALDLVRRHNPGTRVTGLTMFGSVGDLLAATGLVEEVARFDFVGRPALEGMRFLAGLRRQRFDWGVIPYGSNRFEYNVANVVAGARHRLAHRYVRHRLRSWSFLNDIRLDEDVSLHAVEENVRLVQRAGLVPVDVQVPGRLVAPVIPGAIDAEVEEGARRLPGEAAGKTWVAVHASCSVLKNQQQRCYPPEALAAALVVLRARRPDVFYLVFSGGMDAPLTERLVARLPAGCHAIPATPTILHCAAWLGRARLMISNDSGLMHLAASMGVPCATIFGPTNPTFVRPWGVPHRIIARDMPCRPCFQYSSTPMRCPAKLDFACLTGLEPERIVEAASELLKSGGADA
ncbi:MAG TPA: glycosyltransferase family 9 protein [Verrucomicrobiae bacterium]|nr:glycosyltransferase family 9 protein [Verrucomicrobiae bacterium]